MENPVDQNQVDAASAPETDEQPSQAPLSALMQDESVAADPLAMMEEKPPSRLFNQTTLLLVLVCVIAAGTIYAMRLSQSDFFSGKHDSSAVEARIDQALAKLSNPDALPSDSPLRKDVFDALTQDADDVIEMFARDTAENQVPVDQLKMNPFLIRSASGEDVRQREMEEAERKAKERKLELIRAAKRLKLESVVSGRRPVAVIDGEIVTAGTKVGELFVCQSINPDSRAVVLEAEGHRFILRMKSQEDADGRSNTRGIFNRGR